MHEHKWWALGISCGVLGLSSLSRNPAKAFYRMILEKAELQTASNKRRLEYYGNDMKLPVLEYDVLEKYLNATDYNRYLPAQYVFSDATRYQGAIKLAKWIDDNKLGVVTRSPSIKNHNSGNYISTYIWNIDRTATAKWVLNHYRELEEADKKKKKEAPIERKKGSRGSTKV